MNRPSGKAIWVLIILLLPLFYINVKDSLDWGDDFGQYFIQARNIMEHRPQTDNGLVYDSVTGEYALQAYPVGFPLILAGAWSIFGNSVVVSAMTLSIFFIAFGLISFFYFRRYFSDLLSVLLVVIMIYNPFTLGFKKEILSDVPFAVLMLAGVNFFLSTDSGKVRHVLTGILFGAALSVRGIGAIIFPAVLFFLLQQFFRYLKIGDRKALRLEVMKGVIVWSSALLFYVLLNAVIFSVPSGGILQFYSEAMKGQDLFHWIAMNASYYRDVFLNFFATMGGNFQWLSSATKYSLLILLVVGIFMTFLKKPGFDDWFFIAYLGVIFIYPYLGGGFRFLVPILPFLVKYCFMAVDFILDKISLRRQWIPATLALLVIMQYLPGIRDQLGSMKIPEQGPQEAAAREAFHHINFLPAGSVVVFMKPRVLAYYSNKNAAYVARNTDASTLKEIFLRMNAHYFLLCDENEEVNDPLLKKFVEMNANEVKLVWEHEYFRLYSDM